MQHCYSFVAVPARQPDRAPALAARPPVPDPDSGDPRFSEVLSYIETHIDDPDLGVDTLQSSFGVSRPTLYRMFRRMGGVARFIRQRRLAAAHQYLRRRPDMSITWVLYELGFASERQFQRAFHAEYGLSPSEWRERCKASMGEPRGSLAGRPSPYSSFAMSGASR